LAEGIAREDRVVADVVDLVLAFEPRKIKSAVVLAGGGGFGTVVSRKPWLPLPF
jgi:hypothetical protein